MQRAEFRKFFSGGEYLFHLHTSYTDGRASVDEYCSYAVQAGFRSLAIIEHTRQKPTYDFDDLIDDIDRAHDNFPELSLFVGAEAKILPDGSLDIAPELLPKIDILGIACHGFSDDGARLIEALGQAFTRYSSEHPVCVWLHPSTVLKHFTLEARIPTVKKLINQASDCGIFIEWNLVYDVESAASKTWIPENRVVTGANAHSVDDLRSLRETKSW